MISLPYFSKNVKHNFDKKRAMKLIMLQCFQMSAALWRRKNRGEVGLAPIFLREDSKETPVSLAGIAKGRCPFGQQNCERGRLRSQFCCGEESKETGGFVAGESKGDGVPVAHDLARKV